MTDKEDTIDEGPSVALMRLANGFQISQAIHVAAALGVADLLKEGPRSSDQLAPAPPRAIRSLAGGLALVGWAHCAESNFSKKNRSSPLCFLAT